MELWQKNKIREFLKNTTCHSAYNQHENKTIKVSDVVISFDIETTSTYYNHEKIAFMYVWQLCFMKKEEGEEKTYTCYGRTWAEFNEVLTYIKRLHLSLNFIIWVHNLSYEFQFMRKELNFSPDDWVVFAGDTRKPYKATKGQFTFRDTLILTNMSLAKVAKNLVKHKIKKLVGDLDYSLIRHQLTPLNDLELAYCENDVLIVCYYIMEQLDIYDNLSKIPLTNTGRVRDFVRNNCFYTSKNHKRTSKGKMIRYRSLMEFLTLTPEFYNYCVSAFAGGFTHANAEYTNLTVKNVHSIDFTSSYPTVMLAETFPMSPPEEIKIDSLDDYDKIPFIQNGIRRKGLIMNVSFYNIVSAITFECYLSESKAIYKKNVSVNNGRVFSAECLSYVITDIDFEIIRKAYTFTDICFHKCYIFEMNYLPKSILNSIIDLYNKKTTLKGVEGKETEYLINKGMLNSVYGMCVTAIVRDEHLYNNETWETEKGNAIDQIQQYNTSKKRFLYYPWGIYVTAYARYNLWKGIFHFQHDYIYSDTDSIKFINYENHKKWIDDYNEEITNKIKTALEYSGIPYTVPVTQKGIKKPIGVWDYEGKYKEFKTLGAKRYMILDEQDNIHITIAGLSKKEGASYITNQENPFDFFNDEMYIPSTNTGKFTHTYIDDFLECDIVDYTGIKAHVEVQSCVHLEKADFTLSQSEQYKNFLSMFGQGYLLTNIGRLGV